MRDRKIEGHSPAEKNLVLVCGADDKFAMPLAVTLFSAVYNLKKGWVPIIYVIDGGISGKKKKRVEIVLKNSGREFALNWITYDLTNIQSVQSTDVLSKAAYLRILIPDLLPLSHTKAIYLDCDMIVEADLSLLWSEEFLQEPAMGVQDFNFPYISTVEAISNFKDLGLEDNMVYCNSGLIIFNLEVWRNHNFCKKIFAYLNKGFKEFTLFDQDGINVIIAGNWKVLDPRWNVTLSSLPNYGRTLKIDSTKADWYRSELKENPFIIHYTSRYKPWQSGHSSKEALTVYYYDQKHRNRYFYYLQRSRWFPILKFKAWVAYRKLILSVEFKIPRRLGLLKS